MVREGVRGVAGSGQSRLEQGYRLFGEQQSLNRMVFNANVQLPKSIFYFHASRKRFQPTANYII